MPDLQINWKSCPFDDLTLRELHEILRLRVDIFVVEQNCPYPEVDGKDPGAIHLQGTNANAELLAYTRILAPGVSYPEVSIGRVAIHPRGRGGGLGHALMDESLRVVQSQWGDVPIRISAQSHLEGYYQRHGFEGTGKRYLEDGIPHMEMLRAPAGAIPAETGP